MTSKGGGWGWRLVTGATQGGPTCPTRSGLVLHPALRSEHHGTGLTAAPPTRDSSGPREQDLRHRIQDPRHRGPGSSSHPFFHPGAYTHPFTHMHTHRAPWPGRGRAGFQGLRRLHLALSTSFSSCLSSPPSRILGKLSEGRPVPSLALAPLDCGILGAERVGLSPLSAWSSLPLPRPHVR